MWNEFLRLSLLWFLFCFNQQESFCDFFFINYCFVGCKIYARSWVLTHGHIVSPSILSINQKINHCANKPSFVLCRYWLQLLLVCFGDHFNSIKILISLLLCNTLQQPKFPKLSWKLQILWKFLWIQNWKPMQILQLIQPLDWPPHERSFCCLCHLCHNQSSNSPCHQSGFYDY